MKYSFMSFSCPKLSLEEILNTARKYGYDGIEPRLDGSHGHGLEVTMTAEQRTEARKVIEASGVELSCLATSCKFADPAAAKPNVEAAKVIIDLAADLGCPSIRVFGGQYPENISLEQAMESIIASLSELGPYASEKKVNICFETHDSWCDPEHVAAIVSRINCPYIGVNWDVMHPMRKHGYTLKQSYDILKPWIRHVHMHDAALVPDKLVFLPIGQGEIDHLELLKLLLVDGYEGFLSGEWINWEPYEVHLPREIEALKKLEMEVIPR